MPDGEAKIFVEASSSGADAVRISQGCDINTNTANPHNFTMLVKEGLIRNDQGGDYFGTIWAPNSQIQIDQSGGFYGAIVGDGVQIDAGGGFHYDESLGTNHSGVKGVLVTCWLEVLPL